MSDEAYEYFQQAKDLGSGKEQAAIALYDKAIEADPYFAQAYREKAGALQTLGRLEDAVACYDKAIEIEPSYSWGYLSKGICLTALGRVEDALDATEKAIEQDPDCSDAYTWKGLHLLDLGKYKEAVTAFDECVRINPEDKYSYGNKGLALYYLGELEEAIEYFDKQREISSDTWSYYAMKGKALYDLKRSTEGLEHYQKALEIINNGKLVGNVFTDSQGRGSALGAVGMQLLTSVKEIQSMPTLQVSEVQSKELKTEIQRLNEKRDALKLKFINAAAFSANKKKAQQQDEMEILKKELQEIKETYTHLAKEVAQVKADIQDSGMKELAEVKRGFKALEDQDPELLAYCKTFYWTAINLFGAYRAVSTGLIPGNFDSETDLQEQALVEGTKKAASLVTEVAKGIPLVGGVLSVLDNVIDGIYGAVKENRFNNKVAAINIVIQSKLGTEDDISLNVSKVALAITRAKENAILYPEITNETTSKIQAGQKWLSEKMDAIKGKVLPSIELYDSKSAGATLALQDVTLLMAYIYKNHEALVKRKEPLDKQLETIVKLGGLEKLLEGVEENSEKRPEIQLTETETSRQCCTMF